MNPWSVLHPSSVSMLVAAMTAGMTLSLVPPAAAAPRPGRFAVGDSVMVGSAAALRAQGFRVDARVGRQFSTGVRIVRSAARAGSLPRNVIVHLGTNGTVSLRDCRALVTAAGPQRRVFLVTIRVNRSWTAGNNRNLRACDRSFPARRVVLVDWAARSRTLPLDSFGHPASRASRRAYNALIDSAVDRFGL